MPTKDLNARERFNDAKRAEEHDRVKHGIIGGNDEDY